jgi:hypothetical protein
MMCGMGVSKIWESFTSSSSTPTAQIIEHTKLWYLCQDRRTMDALQDLPERYLCISNTDQLQPVQSYHLITHYWHLNFTTDFFELLLSLQNLSCVLLWGLEYVSWGVATHIPRFFFPIKCWTLDFWCYFYVSILNNLHDCQCIIIKCTIAQNVLIFLVWFWYWKNYAQMFYFVIGNMWDRWPLEQKALIFMLGNVMIWSIASS